MQWLLFVWLLIHSFFAHAASHEPVIMIQGVQGTLYTAIKKQLLHIPQEQIVSTTCDILSNNGFFKPTVTLTQKTDQKDKFVLNITKGPLLHISDLDLALQGDGEKDPAILNLLQHFPLKKNDPLNMSIYHDAKITLLEHIKRNGYTNATFSIASIHIDLIKYTADVHLTINTGAIYYFGRIQFDPTYLSPDLLNHYIPFKPYSIFSEEKISELNDALLHSGYFSKVDISESHEPNHLLSLQIHTTPVARKQYAIGIGYGTDTGIRGKASLHLNPVNRDGHTLNTILFASSNETALQGQYSIPGNDPNHTHTDLSTKVASLNYNAGYANTALLTMGKTYQQEQYQHMLSLNELYERFNYNNQPEINSMIFYPKVQLSWFNSNTELFSKNGYKLVMTGLLANKAFLSPINFEQLTIDGRAAITIDPLRTRLYFHAMSALTRTHNIYELPLSLAPLLGGSETLKGYDFYSIGPGKKLTFSSIEIQKETKKNWYVIGFVDRGDVFSPQPRDLKRDAGIGLMWASPIGPIKLSVAESLDNPYNGIANLHPKLVIHIGSDL